jgi:DNA invertase Pin-like site-specific DNA recombinase
LERGGAVDDASGGARHRLRAGEGLDGGPRYIFVDDAVSGADWTRRPSFNALLAALTPRPPFDVLVVSELSRIGRDTVRTPAAILQLEEAGVEIRSYLSDAPISLADESGEIMTVVQSLAASFERRRARQRTYDSHRHKAEAGYVTGGVVFGYDNLRVDGHVERRVNPSEADVVRRIFALYAGGKVSRAWRRPSMPSGWPCRAAIAGDGRRRPSGRFSGATSIGASSCGAARGR